MTKIQSPTRKYIRHKLDKHRKLQQFSTTLYLKYCSLVGPLHTLPNFMIVGFPKCGTTSLYNYLSQHPQIMSPIGKEIDFFDRLYERGINWYRVRFPTKAQILLKEKFLRKKILTGEATPRYIFHPHALYRIKNCIPNCKFIILLRNPIDRAYSHHNMNFHNGYEFRSFEDAINHEEERIKNRYEKLKTVSNYYSWDFDLFAYKEQGKYVNFIKNWFSIFPPKQFLVLQSEKFLQEPQIFYHKTLDFLNLPKWEPDKYSLSKKRDYDSPLNNRLRKSLSDYFKPYNEELFQLLGKKFDWD